MTSDELKTLYKLMVLYMLDRVDFSLTRAQIFDFMLGKEYTDYFKLQSLLNELIESGLIDSITKRNLSHLTITDSGKSTIDYFQNQISDDIKADIEGYLRDKELQIRNELSIQSNYYKSSTGDYIAELVAREKKNELINIKIAMPTEEAVSEMCDNWQKKNQEIYAYLMQELL